MHKRLVNFLDSYNLLYDYQFGFRKKYSTSFAFIDAVTMIQSETYNNNYVMAVFMDLAKAFETVNVGILIKKLEHYGIRGIQLNWFKSYLLDRKQLLHMLMVVCLMLELVMWCTSGYSIGTFVISHLCQ